MKQTYKKNFTGFLTCGPEEEYITTLSGKVISLWSLLSKVGVKRFFRNLTFADAIPQQQQAYKIKITIEAEPLSDKDNAKFWKRLGDDY